MDDLYDNINNYNPNRNQKMLIVFDGIIADMNFSKKIQSIVKELFIRCRKLNIYVLFNTQSYFPESKDNNKKVKKIAINYLVDIDYQIL